MYPKTFLKGYWPRYYSLRFQQDQEFIGRGTSMLVGDIFGNVGIGNFEPVSGGVDNPKSKLHIKDGDIYMEDINSGVIMKSPDGQCWRMQINNNGDIQTSSITCP